MLTRTNEMRGFMKVLIEKDSDRILGFTAFGVEAGEVMAVVQVAMASGLPYTLFRDMILCARPSPKDSATCSQPLLQHPQ